MKNLLLAAAFVAAFILGLIWPKPYLSYTKATYTLESRHTLYVNGDGTYVLEPCGDIEEQDIEALYRLSQKYPVFILINN